MVPFCGEVPEIKAEYLYALNMHLTCFYNNLDFTIVLRIKIRIYVYIYQFENQF